MGKYEGLDNVLQRRRLHNETFTNWFFDCKHECDGRTYYKSYLTDKNRLIYGIEIKEETDSWDDDYTYIVNVYDLNYVDPDSINGWGEEMLFNIQTENGWKEVTIRCGTVCNVRQRMLEHIERYGRKPQTNFSGNTTIVNNPSHIAEIRKMYEDNLITKEEMLDLISKFATQ